MSKKEDRKDQAAQDVEEDDEEAEIMEIRGVVMRPGIHWNVAFERHVVNVYTGLEIYQTLKIPHANSQKIRQMLDESFENNKRMTIDYRIADKEILEVRYR